MGRYNPKKDAYLYSKRVEELVNDNSSAMIRNGEAEHAKIIVKNLFTRGKEIIRIFTGSFRDDIYKSSSVTDALSKFLARENVQLKVLLQQPEKDLNDKTIYKICEDSNQCEIKFVAKGSKDRNLSAHFITMDGKAYRYCPDRDQLKAIASFNSVDTVKHLNELFDELFEQYDYYNNKMKSSL